MRNSRTQVYNRTNQTDNACVLKPDKNVSLNIVINYWIMINIIKKRKKTKNNCGYN